MVYDGVHEYKHISATATKAEKANVHRRVQVLDGILYYTGDAKKQINEEPIISYRTTRNCLVYRLLYINNTQVITTSGVTRLPSKSLSGTIGKDLIMRLMTG